MSYLIIDIETRPNLALRPLFLQTKIFETLKAKGTGDMEKQERKSMATDTDFSEIVCIGIKQIGGETWMLKSIKELETPIWSNFLKQMTLVTFNGKKFDLPIIIKQGLKNHVNLPYERLMGACKPWGYGERHCDLMELMAFGGQWKSLDQYLQIYLNKKKKTVGNNFFDRATPSEIMDHCREDLQYTEDLFSLLMPAL